MLQSGESARGRAVSRCAQAEGRVRCDQRTIPLSKYCLKHITQVSRSGGRRAGTVLPRHGACLFISCRAVATDLRQTRRTYMHNTYSVSHIHITLFRSGTDLGRKITSPLTRPKTPINKQTWDRSSGMFWSGSNDVRGGPNDVLGGTKLPKEVDYFHATP